MCKGEKGNNSEDFFHNYCFDFSNMLKFEANQAKKAIILAKNLEIIAF